MLEALLSIHRMEALAQESLAAPATLRRRLSLLLFVVILPVLGTAMWQIFYLEPKIGNHGLANYFPLDLCLCFKVTHCESCLVLHLVIWPYREE